MVNANKEQVDASSTEQELISHPLCHQEHREVK